MRVNTPVKSTPASGANVLAADEKIETLEWIAVWWQPQGQRRLRPGSSPG